MRFLFLYWFRLGGASQYSELELLSKLLTIQDNWTEKYSAVNRFYDFLIQNQMQLNSQDSRGRVMEHFPDENKKQLKISGNTERFWNLMYSNVKVIYFLIQTAVPLLIFVPDKLKMIYDQCCQRFWYCSWMDAFGHFYEENGRSRWRA